MADTFDSRYARHIILKEIGKSGQEKLLKSRVLIIGAGGLGSPVALYLAAAGVGTIGIADGDRVDISNLQRQVIHTTADLNKPKVISAKESLLALNPGIRVNAYFEYITESSLTAMAADYDMVIDAADSFKAKFIINDSCVKAGKPFCHGGIEGFKGQVMTCLPGETACLRCIFPTYPEDSYSPTGVIGALPGVIGSLQAMEAVKYITGAGRLLTNSLLTYDALNNSLRTVAIPRDEGCSLCGSPKA